MSKQLNFAAGVAERVQELVAELEDVHDDAGEVHPLLRLWAEERDQVTRTAKVAVSAGVKERALELPREQVQMMAELIRATFNDPPLGLIKKQRDEGIKAFARRMRVTETSANSEELSWAREVIARHDMAVRQDPDRRPPSS